MQDLQSSSIDIFDINKTNFVSGLFWQSIPSESSHKEEIKNLSDQLSLDLHCPKDGRVFQIGYVSSKSMKSKKAYSLASVVFDYIKETEPELKSWVCALELPGGKFSYVAVSDSAIIPDSDISGTQEEVFAKLKEHISVGRFEKIFCPDEFGVVGSKLLNVSDVVGVYGKKIKKHPDSLIKPVVKKTNYALIVTVAVLVGGGVFGFNQYQKYQEEKLLEDIRIKAEQAAEKAREMGLLKNKKQPSSAIKPWKISPDFLSNINACLSSLTLDKAVAGGWKLTDFNCNQSSTTFKYERTRTPISYLKSALPEASFDIDGIHASYTQPITPDQRSGGESIESSSEVFNVISKFQSLNVKVNVKELAPPPPAVSQGEEVPPPPDFKTYIFDFSTKYDVNRIMKFVMTEGMTLNNISFKPATTGIGEYTISFNLYTNLN